MLRGKHFSDMQNNTALQTCICVSKPNRRATDFQPLHYIISLTRIRYLQFTGFKSLWD